MHSTQGVGPLARKSHASSLFSLAAADPNTMQFPSRFHASHFCLSPLFIPFGSIHLARRLGGSISGVSKKLKINNHDLNKNKNNTRQSDGDPLSLSIRLLYFPWIFSKKKFLPSVHYAVHKTQKGLPPLPGPFSNEWGLLTITYLLALWHLLTLLFYLDGLSFSCPCFLQYTYTLRYSDRCKPMPFLMSLMFFLYTIR